MWQVDRVFAHAAVYCERKAQIRHCVFSCIVSLKSVVLHDSISEMAQLEV